MVISSLWYTRQVQKEIKKKEKVVSFFMLNKTLKAWEFPT